MKTSKLFALGILLLVTSLSQSQVSVNVNIGKPPAWGPTITTEEYYYLPDINSYYDIRQSQFIYLNNGTWIRTKKLPKRYNSYNLNSGYVVVLDDYHGRNPYSMYKNHKIKYYKENNNLENSRGNNKQSDNDKHRGNGKGKGNKKGKHD
jgi:hypothetical protein